ncbi:6-hydroxymethylpterin diphosphokinase MptE-like protein [Desulfosporosinus sp. FKA]|uniref:motility associated factor glycosyltransferase family protein n=1 Tax=Desulfosporosinus sp. FKA TaxID=1969834 RepID=UPI000B497EA6|nr:6-hydroxymethylpterin diphosphokinase MptE-like protein [Desulfosporosinus sp. FKA]
MNFYEKNLAFLITQGFEEQVLNQPLETSTVSLFSGKTGYYTATKRIEGQEILLHSAYDPLSEAAKLIVSEDNVTSYRAIFLFGLGLGYHLIELLDRTPPSSLIIVLETDWDIVRAAMHVIDFQEILATGRVVLAFGKPSEIRAIFDGIIIMGEVLLKIQRMGFIYFAPKYRTEYETVKEIRSLVFGVIQYHRHAIGVDIGWTVRGLNNFVAHIPYLVKNPSLRNIANTWGKPVVIVLAGPSLTKNIAVLKEWQDRVTIFCVNTVFNKLLDYGIIPDATFSVDRTPLIPECHYKRDEPIPESIAFVANPVVDTRSARLFKHHLFVYGGGEYFENELAQALDSGTLAMGLSVTHFAFNFANLIGAPAIILIGQDLAFGEEGRTHSSGSVYDTVKANLENEDQVVYLEGYYGEKVPSTLAWRMFRDWFEIFLERFPTLVINATEGGAKINGMVQLTLREALEKHVGVDSSQKDSFVDWLNSVSQNIVPEDNVEKVKKSFVERIEKLSIDQLVYTKASDLYDYVNDPDVSLEFKKRYLDQMYETAYKILGNNWIYSAFRSEFIRTMGDYINLNDGLMDNDSEEMVLKKAKLLRDMFADLNEFLVKLKIILEDALLEFDKDDELLRS